MKTLKLYSKSRKRRIGPEARLQMAIVQYLKLAGVQNLLYFSVPNEGKRSRINGDHLRRMGLTSGVSDLVIVIPNLTRGINVLFLELKAKGGKATDNQLAFRDAAIDAGAHWALADNIETAISILREYGAIKNVARRRSSPLSRKAA